MALQNEGISYADTLLARAQFFPSINTSVNQTFLSSQPGALFNTLEIYTAEKSALSFDVTARQILYDFGARRALHDASLNAFDISRLNTQRIKNRIALEFVSAYYDILETEKIQMVTEKEIDSLASHLAIAKSLYEEGVITKNDLLQAEVRLSDARQRLLAIINRRAIGVARINNLLSRPPSENFRLIDTRGEPRISMTLVAAWQAADMSRTEIKIADHDLKIAGLEESAKKTDFLPTFFTAGGYSYTENRYLISKDTWSLIFGMNLNLFSGKSTTAELSKISHRRQQLIEHREKLRDDIRLEIETYHRNMEDARERTRVTKEAIGQAEENLRINTIRYREGAGTATDVLDAITLLTVAQTNYYRALYEFKRSEAGFAYAIGKDLAAEYR
jgi:outer membrane protein TolC